MASKVLGIVGASIENATYRPSSPYTTTGAQTFRRKCLERGYDLPFVSFAGDGSTMAGMAPQITNLVNALTPAGLGFDIFAHFGGNDAGPIGNYPAAWDAGEITTYTNSINTLLGQINATAATHKLCSNLSYRTNFSGADQLNADIIEPRIAALMVAPLVPYWAYSSAAAALGNYPLPDNLHPTNVGVEYLQDALLDTYLPIAGFTPTDIEDQLVTSFGEFSSVIPNVTRINAVGSAAISTPRGATGTITLAGGNGSTGSGSPAGTSYQFDAAHRDFVASGYFGNNNPVTITVSMPAWANRVVRVKVAGHRAVSGRVTNVTINGVTQSYDPNIPASSSTEFLAVMDGSGVLVAALTPVVAFVHASAMSVSLIKLPSSGGAGVSRNLALSLGLHL